ncbi:MAG: hypothetical protein ACI80V_002267 [Rhodothermales bacterium]|jgi:hypothetical protein
MIIPKTLGALYWRSLTPMVVRMLTPTIWLMWPLVKMAEGLTYLMSRGRERQTLHRDEFPALADVGEVQVNLREMSSEALVELQLNQNDWYVRHARRLLQERGPDPAVHEGLKTILNENTDVKRRLRALWALNVTDGLSDGELEELLLNGDEYVRSWAVQFLAEDGDVSASTITKLAELAGSDESQLVRLYITSALQRLPEADRWDTLAELSARAEDAGVVKGLNEMMGGTR